MLVSHARIKLTKFKFILLFVKIFWLNLPVKHTFLPDIRLRSVHSIVVLYLLRLLGVNSKSLTLLAIVQVSQNGCKQINLCAVKARFRAKNELLLSPRNRAVSKLFPKWYALLPIIIGFYLFFLLFIDVSFTDTS